MIAPSILSADFASLKEILINWEKTNAIKLIHFDVMDNHFVPNLTFGHQFIKSLRPYTQIPFDVHLMIENPLTSLPLYIDAGAQYISFHIEALSSDISIKTLEPFRQKIKLGLALRPHTPLKTLFPFLEGLDFVLLMSVNPGFSGQSFLEETFERLQELDRIRKKEKLPFQIEVDGGINKNNMLSLMKDGADMLVMGSSFFNDPNPQELLELYEQYREELRG